MGVVTWSRMLSVPRSSSLRIVRPMAVENCGFSNAEVMPDIVFACVGLRNSTTADVSVTFPAGLRC